MKRRPSFQATGWDALEERQLLSGGLATLRHIAAQIAAQTRAARLHGKVHSHVSAHPRVRAHLAHPLATVTQPAVSISMPSVAPTAYTVTTPKITAQGIRVPENTMPSTAVSTAVATAPTSTAGTASTSAITPTLTAPIVAGTQTPLPTSIASAPTLVAGGFSTGLTASNPYNAPPLIATTGMPPAPGIVAPGSTATMPTVSTDHIIAGNPGFAPGMSPGSPLTGVTLSATDVAALKQAVDSFATNYTSGADATKDKAATDALQASLNNLALTVWSESHVASKDAVTAFQKAADNFAQNYTGGLDSAKDTAAWNALSTAMTNLLPQNGTPGGPAIGTLAPGMMPMLPPGGFDPSSLHITSTLDAGQPLTADEVSTLKSLVDTFATDYTNGADATADQSAANALFSGLDNLFTSHWGNMATTTTPAVPTSAPPPVVMPVTATTASTASAAAATAANPSTAPTSTAVTTASTASTTGTTSTSTAAAAALAKPQAPTYYIAPGSINPTAAVTVYAKAAPGGWTYSTPAIG